MTSLTKEHLDKQLSGLHKTLTALNTRLDHQIGDVRKDLNTQITGVRKDIGALDDKLEREVDKLARVVSDASTADRKHLEAQLHELKQDLVPPSHVQNLERRITKLESKAV